MKAQPGPDVSECDDQVSRHPYRVAPNGCRHLQNDVPGPAKK
jgi:hypothetical protein